MLFLIIFAAVLIIVLAVSYGAYRFTFHSPHKGQNDIFTLPAGEAYLAGREGMRAMIKEMAAIGCEMIETRSHDALRLAGRYYHTRVGAPLAICFHGYRATSIRDFCGGARLLLELGYNVILVDQRSQGASEGHSVTFGVLERYDVLSWISYARERFGKDVPITLYGISMGAATVLMAAGFALPENVRGIVADSPYSSPKDIIQKVARDMKLPPRLSWPFVSIGANLFGRFDPAACTAAGSVEGCDIPILIIHGGGDRFVPPAMSREIAAANPAIERHEFPDAAHGISFLKDRPRYEAIVREFTAKCNE